MKAKYLIPLTAAAMFAMTACTVEVTTDEEEPVSSSSVEPAPESSSSVEEYSFTSRINDVKKEAQTYCTTKAENAGLNGYMDASVTGFGTVAVTVTQDMNAKTIETVLEIKVDSEEEEIFNAVCEDMIDEDDVYSSCDKEKKIVVSVTKEGTDHIMNNTTMTNALDELCEVFTSFEEELLPDDATYDYKSLTYCEIIPGATEADGEFYDCEELPVKKVDAASVILKGNEDGTYSINAYYGDEEDYGFIEDTYTLVGFDEDELGSYWEFEREADPTNEDDAAEVLRIYGGDFAVLRAKDDSYYYSWSNVEGVYKKIAKVLKK